MEIAKIEVGRTTGICTRRGRIPARIVGASVQVSFADPVWDKLIKTVVFRGKETRIAEFDGDVAVIPHEVIPEPGIALYFGIFGHDPDSDLQIPLIEVRLGTTEASTDPDADPGADPTLPIWAQLKEDVSDLAERVDNMTPGGPGGDVNLDGYATEQWVKDQGYLTDVPDGYAKTSEIPKKAEDIGALPSTYTPPNQTAEQVGADPKGTAASTVSQHNSSADSHGDIRLELKAINDRLNAFFDSDNQTLDELSEIVAYITSNKSLIDSITTSKVSVADIVNNLTTNVINKPLSASQGVVLKGLIDAVSKSLSNYQPKGEYLTEVPDGYATEEWVEEKLEEHSGGNVDLTGYATEQFVRDGYQPKGDYALKSEIPAVPVQSVNGKTGAVKLSASDVGARPNNWMPSSQEVGALPNTYTPPNQTAEQVGADAKGTAESAVSQHNASADSHGDIRLELKAINDKLTAFFDSDNQTLDELSEIVAYITSNKSLIDSITTSKVSVADIVNNLTSNVTNKPLSAAQGVVLKGLIDAVSTRLANYQPKGDYALRSEIPTVPTKVSQFQNDAGYLTQHQDISGKLDAAELPTAIDTAIAQAKASGEFDGEDGHSPYIFNGNWFVYDADKGNYVDSGIQAKGDMGDPGQRGTGLLPVTTAPSGYTTAVGGITPKYRMSLSTIKTQAGVTEVILGDTIQYSYYHYPIAYLDASYAYFTTRVSIRGATGEAGTTPVKGTDYYTDADKTEMVNSVIAALPKYSGGVS